MNATQSVYSALGRVATFAGYFAAYIAARHQRFSPFVIARPLILQGLKVFACAELSREFAALGVYALGKYTDFGLLAVALRRRNGTRFISRSYQPHSQLIRSCRELLGRHLKSLMGFGREKPCVP